MVYADEVGRVAYGARDRRRVLAADGRVPVAYAYHAARARDASYLLVAQVARVVARRADPDERAILTL